MNQPKKLIATTVSTFKKAPQTIPLAISSEIVRLLSDQLYQSPIKAIEELVVNAYDAHATECRLYVPQPGNDEDDFIVVFDNGIGMDHQGLLDLWQIGRSNKRRKQKEIEQRSKRKQIGKFGIGKLATYTIAKRLTYITKSGGAHQDQIRSVTINFTDFSASRTGASEFEIPVWQLDDWDEFAKQTYMQKIVDLTGIDASHFLASNGASWTIAILEELKPKAHQMKFGRLRWVLSTAMPLGDDFCLYLNGEEIRSSKETYEKVVEFKLSELPKERLQSLKKSTGEPWSIKGEYLKASSFESGISGTVFMTQRSLAGKSDDLGRSHGFFIKVRGRLVNEDDALFGLKALHHGHFNRFRAVIEADDLDQVLKASRETIEESGIKEHFRILLREVFREASSRYERHLKKEEQQERPKKEGEKKIVSPRLVEYAVADALVAQMVDPHFSQTGAEADEGWFYIEIDKSTNLKALIHELYTAPRQKYSYQYTERGPTSRLVEFDPQKAVFWINEDHDLVKEYVPDYHSKRFLEDFVTAEALLEVYLRESQMPPHILGEVLEQRDALLRHLVRDHSYSLKTISRMLSDAIADQYELEIAMVVAARALGFVAKQISGSGEPDGIARFIDYPDGEKKITLEAKSSAKTPSLSAIDFSGLHEHMLRHQADGCLLLAPAYPGHNRGNESAVAFRANELKISCWTISQLARLIAKAESRELNAKDVLDIVLNCFSPEEVAKAVDQLLTEPAWDMRELYIAILSTIKELEGFLPNSARTIEMIAYPVCRSNPNLANVQMEEIRRAVRELAGASKGGMTLRDDKIIIHVSLDELERRLSGLLAQSAKPRKESRNEDLIRCPTLARG